jgi:hypothetical protein
MHWGRIEATATLNRFSTIRDARMRENHVSRKGLGCCRRPQCLSQSRALGEYVSCSRDVLFLRFESVVCGKLVSHCFYLAALRLQIRRSQCIRHVVCATSNGPVPCIDICYFVWTIIARMGKPSGFVQRHSSSKNRYQHARLFSNLLKVDIPDEGDSSQRAADDSKERIPGPDRSL